MDIANRIMNMDCDHEDKEKEYSC